MKTLFISLVLPILVEFSYERSLYSPLFTDEAFNKHVSGLYTMRKIQMRIVGLQPGNSTVTVDEYIEKIKSAKAKKPDEQPYLFEGDIVLTEDQMEKHIENLEDHYWARQGVYNATKDQARNRNRTKRSLTSDLSLRWTQFPIPYYINTATGVDENAVQAGIAKWEQDTCITFSRLSYLPPFGNALTFVLSDGCWSYIGRIGSTPQQISIGIGCTSLGTVCHEIEHALGAYHEQSRYDRDSYVQILTQNIEPTYLNQFTKESASAMIDYGVGYDYGSVMHYDGTSFTDDGGYTVATLDVNFQNTIGQRIEPSFADVKRVNSAYCNDSCSTKLACQNGGYTDPKNCQVCRCPPAFGGQLCNMAAPSPSQCGGGNRIASATQQTINISGTVTCAFIIQAPSSSDRVAFQITSLSFPNQAPCANEYVEINYGTDMTRTGARFCNGPPTLTVSATQMLTVIYKGGSRTRLNLAFKISDGNDVFEDPAETETSSESSQDKTQFRNEMNESSDSSGVRQDIKDDASTSSTSILQSSSVQPGAVEKSSTSISSAEAISQTDSTAYFTSSISTPSESSNSNTASFPEPIETITSSQLPASISTPSNSVSIRNSTTPVAVDVSTTVAPSNSSILPSPSTPTLFPPTSVVCGSWSECNAHCGGCGTRSQKCGEYIRTEFCNKQPCQGGYCCSPFTYIAYPTAKCHQPSDVSSFTLKKA